MARQRTLKLAILNIKIGPPHSPQNYIRLFEMLNELQPEEKLLGERQVKFIRSEAVGGAHQNGMIGQFFSYTEIQGQWLDMSSLEPLLDEEGNPITPVRTNLKPNMKTINFVFYPEGHRLMYIVNDGPGVKNFAKCFRRMVNQPEFQEAFGEVFVEVEQDEDSIARILRLPNKTKLEIDFSLPNPDAFGDLAQELQEKIQSQNVARFNQKMTGRKDGEGIEPDEETTALMDIAVSNGSVSAVGHDGTKKVYESTASYPKVDSTKYDPQQTTMLAYLLNRGQTLIRQLRSR
ncbi:DUF4747 family protein [Halodesulfovibrio sp.]|jgi:hypothetical protein|uniref:DUF4747 family protein n=1 Tax=Halodesulfovibrio sp. TaxID=1912772 RepID=UPI0025CE350C|nr:DUF4747 family protein [Halodesulfovibrio sp.]MCT4627508.1 DUF4747 family protein [Halodesulfovibrio sp.]